MNVTPHIAQNTHGGRRRSNIDGRSTRHEGYGVSLISRSLLEQVFGWTKGTTGEAETRYLTGLATAGEAKRQVR